MGCKTVFPHRAAMKSAGGPLGFGNPNLAKTLSVELDVEKRLQAAVLKDRIRIKEFFHDFDRLRKGHVAESAVSYLLTASSAPASAHCSSASARRKFSNCSASIRSAQGSSVTRNSAKTSSPFSSQKPPGRRSLKARSRRPSFLTPRRSGCWRCWPTSASTS
jgi:hypothetical protein